MYKSDDRLDDRGSIRRGVAPILKRGAAELGIRLDAGQLAQFQRFHAELVDWNSKVNLTRVTEWEEAQSRHYLDSLTAVKGVPRRVLEAGRFLDVGSGAGMPGVPLKIAFPGMKGVLIEAVAKKAEFLAHVARILGLDGLDVRCARAEVLAHDLEFRGTFDLVLSRAVSSAAALAELTLPFCLRGGLSILYKTRSADDEVERAATAIAAMGGVSKDVIDVSVSGLSEGRTLAVLEKVTDTPDRYPRRPGIPAKRPL